MLNHILLVVCLFITLGIIIYLFYWNQVLGFLLSVLLRLWTWNQGGTAVWVSFGSVHFSILAGRISFKDLRYHSCNQTIKIVRCRIEWRYWIRRPMAYLNDALEKHPFRPFPCRIQFKIEGLEWFMYNRIPAYDYIVSELGARNRPNTPAMSPSGQATPLQDIFAKPISRTMLYPPSSTLPTSVRRVPRFLDRLADWFYGQLPRLDPKDLLPIQIQVSKAAVTCGNASTTNILVVEFGKAEGVAGIVPSRSICDKYKQNVNLSFHEVRIHMLENDAYQAPMSVVGRELYHKVKHTRSRFPWASSLSYGSFAKLWRRLNLHTSTSIRRSARLGPVQTAPTNGTFRQRLGGRRSNVVDDEHPPGIDFSEVEYAIERHILEAPIVEISYYVDAVGRVPAVRDDPTPAGEENYDIGNGALPPEWGLDVVIRGGTLRYGPWADRRRIELQKVFFPPTYLDAQVTPQLKPGDQRIWTTLKLFVELRDGTVLHVPFREPSKDWQWDGLSDIPRPKRRSPANLNLRVGDGSTISYIMPLVAGPNGYEPQLEIHLDDVSVTSSLNDIRLLSSESCRVRCDLPSPLRWQAERQWTFEILLRQPRLYLLRDHINMFTDLSKDWAHGPPSDLNRFIPMNYAIKMDLRNYEINAYVNDLNIIDKPLLRDENALLTLRGGSFRNETQLAMNRFRPESTLVPLWIESPGVAVHLTLPKWNTHSMDGDAHAGEIGTIGFLRLDGSYRYFAEVRDNNIEQLKLSFTTKNMVYKAHGWSIRYLMILRDNYFGSFTHFSTLYESIGKWHQGVPVGDPIELQYRPNKSNILQVEVQLEAQNNAVIMPTSLQGCGRFADGVDTTSPPSNSIVVLEVPTFQVQLRTHEYLMEMSLNIHQVKGGIVNHYRSLVDLGSLIAGSDEVFVVDGMEIVAHKLFGPQPRTATYVCIWEIEFGSILASVSADQSAILSAAMNVFHAGFSDPFNAPAAEYAIPADPDVTFLRVAVQSADVTWMAGDAALRFDLPCGLSFQSNDLSTESYQKVTSAKLPPMSVQAFSSATRSRNLWLEAAVLTIDVDFDLYTSPPGWRDKAKAQAGFLLAQDDLTGRLTDVFSHLSSQESCPPHACPALSKLKRGLHITYPRVPIVSQNPVLVQPRTTRPVFARPASLASASSVSDIGEESGKKDMDTILARTRPTIVSDVVADDDDTYSGDESDDDGLTDASGSAQHWSDCFNGSSEGHELESDAKYIYLTAHYTTAANRPPSLWAGRGFSLTKVNPYFASFTARSTDERVPGPTDPSNTKSLDKTFLRLTSSHVAAFYTPRVLSVVEGLCQDFRDQTTRPDIIFDGLIMSHVDSLNDAPSSPTFAFQIGISTVNATLLQHLSAADFGPSSGRGTQEQPYPTQFPEEDVTTLHVSLGNVTASGTIVRHDKQQPSVSMGVCVRSLSLELQDVHCPPAAPRGSREHGTPSLVSVNATEISASYQDSHIRGFFGSIQARSRHDTPRYLLASATALAEHSRLLTRAYSQLRAHIFAIRWRTIRTVLAHATERPFVDPFSTTQPSYLVQSGLPQRLRTDTILKVLIHLRNLLPILDVSQPQGSASTPPAEQHDISSLLDVQLQNFAPDPEAVVTARLPLLSALSLGGDANGKAYPFGRPDHRSSPLRSADVSVTTMYISLAGHPGEPDCGLKVGPIVISATKRSSRYTPVSTKPEASSGPSSATGEDRMDFVALCVSLGDSTVTIVPHVLDFIPHVIRALRRPRTAPTPSPSSLKADSTHPYTIEATLSVPSFRLQAAAANLICEVGMGNLLLAGTTSSHLPNRIQDLQRSTSLSIILGHIFLRGRSTDGHTKQERDILASLEFHDGKGNVAIQDTQRSSEVRRIMVGFHGVELRVPRSAIRLYRFVEEWRSTYLPPLQQMMDNMIVEIHKPSLLSVGVDAKKPKRVSLQLQLSVTSIRTTLQVMLGTWLSWEILSTTAYLHTSPNPRRASLRFFGLQVGSQVLSVASRENLPDDHDPTTRVKLAFPQLSVSGRFDDAGLYALMAVEFFHVTIKPSHWDTVLAVQQKFGNDFQDLVTLIAQTRRKTAPSSHSPVGTQTSREQKWRYAGFLKMRGFRVGMEGLTSTIFLECQDINGGANNEEGRVLQLHLSNLALSLSSGARMRTLDPGLRRTHGSAFVNMDVQVNLLSGRSPAGGHILQIAIPKIHAVMQPSSIGEFADYVDQLQTEISERQEHRAHQLAEFKEKTQHVMRTFDIKKEPQQDQASWIDQYSVDFSVRNIGVAFPLSLDLYLELPQNQDQTVSSVPAFLFTVSSLVFASEHGESGQATMKGFCFQFVPRFSQSAAGDFVSASHKTFNRLLYPEVTAQARFEQVDSSRRMRLSAQVSGFIVDMDSSLPDYVFSLVDVYQQGKSRVSQLTAHLPRMSSPATSPAHSQDGSDRHPRAIPMSNAVASLKFRSGEVRLYSASAAGAARTLSKITVLSNESHRLSSSGPEVFRLPEVTVWGEYRASTVVAASGGSGASVSTLTFKSTVHSSQNVIRPTLLPFLSEFNDRLEVRIRKEHWREPSLDPPSERPRTETTTDDASAHRTTPMTMEIRFGLRIDRSKLELTCQPDVNVIAGLNWESGGFVLSVSPGAHRIAFTGDVGGLTVGLKHGFLSEDCIQLHARDLAFSATFARLSERGNSLSLVINTEFSGSARLSRLQDMLCFKAVWLDRIPTFGTQSQAAPATPFKPAIDLPSSSPSSKTARSEIATVILVRVRRTKLAVDLGHSISNIHLDLTNTTFRTRLTSAVAEISLHISEVSITPNGNISGIALVPDFVFQTVRRREVLDDANLAGENRMLELVLTSGPFTLALESEHQKLLQYRAEPIKVLVYDDWSLISSRRPQRDRRLRLSFLVVGSEVVATATVSTVPKLFSYVEKFKANVAAQREGASRESQAFRVARQPKPDNPLSAVANAILQNARNRFKEAERAISYEVVQELSLQLGTLRLNLFPRTMGDTDMAQFTGREVQARLERIVRADGKLAARDLRLAFSSMAISRFSSLNHAMAARKAPTNDLEWMQLITQRAPEATIFALPAMRIKMTSEEELEGKRIVLIYDFYSRFLRGATRGSGDDIYISLNVSLYSWLTVLRKNFTREMDDALKVKQTGSSPAMPAPVQRKFPEPIPMGRTRQTLESQPSPDALSPLLPAFNLNQGSKQRAQDPSPPGSPTVAAMSGSDDGSPTQASVTLTAAPAEEAASGSSRNVIYRPRHRQIERLTMRQLGEATPDVMHPFFMKKAGFNLEESLPQYVHEYATIPMEEIMEALLELYGRQLGKAGRTAGSTHKMDTLAPGNTG
ncbi:hypothetical protein PUNSTDRAFT_98433 [Punctularia strigosozonata HHB-11173 SS5]|uniref:uncharacterized protein n=1 Tax=Punctularia strigosozonata (strain HHB-11173) TaxID=741275 RepID=UPI00044180EF|nr:uncharacterized protein PUNSTDRAFT_98433 [Punctularia strigosozonata HHB-11173 SS5]EIN11333.1 hypothetical protein PUNSTDRAFT_98433 [Punctularia strigosozonata HHB-11173 SS5]